MTTGPKDTKRAADNDCVSFQAILPDYLDQALTPDAADTAAAHIAACAECRALVHDLHAIRTQAAALPVLRPTRDLWPAIDARIAERSGASARLPDGRERTKGQQVESRGPGGIGMRAAVMPGQARQRALRRWFGPQYATRVAALAAGLVIATATVTYVATRWLVGPSPVQAVPGAPAGAAQVIASGVPSANGPAGTPAGGTATSAPKTAGTGQAGVRDRPSAGTGLSTTATFVSAAPTSEYLYDPQIASLRKILNQRRAQLDPKTVAIIEGNLRVIDTAIAQSKAALAKDPANGFLVDQLDRDLDTKLELLRTVALLPSRT